MPASLACSHLTSVCSSTERTLELSTRTESALLAPQDRPPLGSDPAAQNQPTEPTEPVAPPYQFDLPDTSDGIVHMSIDVDARVAGYWLDHNLPNNRRAKTAKIIKMARDMGEGNWDQDT